MQKMEEEKEAQRQFHDQLILQENTQRNISAGYDDIIGELTNEIDKIQPKQELVKVVKDKPKAKAVNQT